MNYRTRICRQQSTTPIQQQEAPQPFFTPVVQAKEKENGNQAGEGFEEALANGGSGDSLPAHTRGFMESSMGADFSNVRVHHDAKAAQMSSHIQAKAFTHQNDIYFNKGEYAPESAGGQHLLAHELTHVMQQRSGSVQRSIQRAEYATYISTNIEDGKEFIDGAQGYFKNWGYPNVKKVDTVEDILLDLAKSKTNIDKFRIVAHANPTGLKLGMMKDLSPGGFGKSHAELNTKQAFNNMVAPVVLMDDATFTSWTTTLLGDPAAQPILAGLGITAVPGVSSNAGLMLRGVLEGVFMDIAELDTGGPVTFKNRALLDKFNNLRRNSYSEALTTGMDVKATAAFRKNLAALPAAAIAALAAKKTTVKFTQSEADSFGEGLKNDAGTDLKDEIKVGIREGSGKGSFLKNLESGRKPITKATHLEIRGCNVGRDKNVLESFRSFFGSAGNEPMVTAPDLFEYFFALNFQTFTGSPADTKSMQDLWANDAQFGKDYNFYNRLRKKDLIKVASNADKKLDEVITRYSLSLSAAELKQLNPEIKDPDNLSLGQEIWLKARQIPVDAGVTTMDDFCTKHFNGTGMKADILKNNPGIKDPDKLTTGQIIEVAPAALSAKTGYISAEITQADYEKDIRSGKAHMFLSGNKPKIIMDNDKYPSAFANWLAAQNYGIKKETAADLEKKLKGEAYLRSRYLNMLSHNYPDPIDPILPDDPRYAGHIKKAP